MALSCAIGTVMSKIILTILWLVGFGIYALALKIIRIPSHFAKPPATFWIDAVPDESGMKYQF